MKRLLAALWTGRGQVWVAAALMGALGSLLAYLGNPTNTGICISCFLENAAGALGLHANPRMQYIRPELLGFFLGSFAAAAAAREFRPRWRGAGLALFGMGLFMAVGSAVFIGCPIKALLRLAAGDLTALAGAGGLLAGVWGGLKLLEAGEFPFQGAPRRAPAMVGWALAAAAAGLTVLAFLPGVLAESRTGGGALHAPLPISLAAGFVLGTACQRSRFCVTGSVRDALLTRTWGPGLALAVAVGTAAAVNAFTGQIRVGYYDQPGAHLEWVWSLAGMGLVGAVAVLAGGCPFRQIVKAGEGDLDAATVVAGMLVGAALIQNWGIGATAAGVPPGGRVAVLLGWAAVLSLGLHGKEPQP